MEKDRKKRINEPNPSSRKKYLDFMKTLYGEVKKDKLAAICAKHYSVLAERGDRHYEFMLTAAKSIQDYKSCPQSDSDESHDESTQVEGGQI